MFFCWIRASWAPSVPERRSFSFMYRFISDPDSIHLLPVLKPLWPVNEHAPICGATSCRSVFWLQHTGVSFRSSTFLTNWWTVPQSLQRDSYVGITCLPSHVGFGSGTRFGGDLVPASAPSASTRTR